MMVETTTHAHADVTQVCSIVRGKPQFGTDRVFKGPAGAFALPALDLTALSWSRAEPLPALNVPIAEILDLLAETGKHLKRDENGYLSEALDNMAISSPLDRGVIERAYERLPLEFDPDEIRGWIRGDLGSVEILDQWRSIEVPGRGKARVKVFPPRLVHILAGNAPAVASMSVIRGAVLKGVNLFKLPSNDLFSVTAILRVMATLAPDHPTIRSFSATYWRGGDKATESLLFRPQFFDKLVAWGGESALRSAKDYIGPGFELVSFDPKTSISFVGREAHESDATLREAARLAAIDVTHYDQSACVCSRFNFVEGSEEQVDRYCEALHGELGVQRDLASGTGPRITGPLRDEIDALAALEPIFRVWGDCNGGGVVIRSDEPVDFHPEQKVVNVVRVASLTDAMRHATVATQTVGVFPASRKAELRDGLYSAGVQRVIFLGGANSGVPGVAHDGFFPMHRLARWVNDEG